MSDATYPARGDDPASSMTIREKLAMAGLGYAIAGYSLTYADSLLTALEATKRPASEPQQPESAATAPTDEHLVEKVARAMWRALRKHIKSKRRWEDCPRAHDAYFVKARAAIAAVREHDAKHVEPSPCPSTKLLNALREFRKVASREVDSDWSDAEANAYERLCLAIDSFDSSPAGAASEQARIDRATIEKLEELALKADWVSIVHDAKGWTVGGGTQIGVRKWTEYAPTLAETLEVK